MHTKAHVSHTLRIVRAGWPHEQVASPPPKGHSAVSNTDTSTGVCLFGACHQVATPLGEMCRAKRFRTKFPQATRIPLGTADLLGLCDAIRVPEPKQVVACVRR